MTLKIYLHRLIDRSRRCIDEIKTVFIFRIKYKFQTFYDMFLILYLIILYLIKQMSLEATSITIILLEICTFTASSFYKYLKPNLCYRLLPSFFEKKKFRLKTSPQWTLLSGMGVLEKVIFFFSPLLIMFAVACPVPVIFQHIFLLFA